MTTNKYLVQLIQACANFLTFSYQEKKNYYMQTIRHILLHLFYYLIIAYFIYFLYLHLYNIIGLFLFLMTV